MRKILDLELWYLKNQSILVDLKLILITRVGGLTTVFALKILMDLKSLKIHKHGEVSSSMLKSIGINSVIIGHS